MFRLGRERRQEFQVESSRARPTQDASALAGFGPVVADNAVLQERLGGEALLFQVHHRDNVEIEKLISAGIVCQQLRPTSPESGLSRPSPNKWAGIFWPSAKYATIAIVAPEVTISAGRYLASS